MGNFIDRGQENLLEVKTCDREECGAGTCGGDTHGIRECKRHRHHRRWAAGVMALAVLAGVLAGCGSGAGSSVVHQAQAGENGREDTQAALTEKGKNEQERQGDTDGDSGGTGESPVVEAGKITAGETEVSLEADDEYAGWDESSAVKIDLDDSGITIDGQGAKAQGSTVTIEKSGTYILTGALSDGTILVDAGDDDKVRLVLDGVDIHSETSAPIDIKKAGKAVVSLEEGTVNSLSDSPSFTYRNEEKEEPNAALFSKNDLTINGNGTLKVTGTFNNGIGSKDILKIVGGTIEVEAANNGLKGNDALAVYGGQMKINAVGDGVKSDILAAVLGGDVTVSDCEEGLEAETVAIYGGTIDLTARDDGINASTDGTNTPQIYFAGGTVTVRAEGDGIDSNGSIHMSGGDVTVYGPSGRGNGAIDYDREFTLTGGTLAAFGPGGMEQNVSSADSRVSVLLDFQETQEAGTVVTLRDKEGNELYRGAGEKAFRTVVISTPKLEPGSEYEAEAGGTVISFVPEETVVYANKEGIQSQPANAPGRGGPGGRGGRVDGEKGIPPEGEGNRARPERPQDEGN